MVQFILTEENCFINKWKRTVTFEVFFLKTLNLTRERHACMKEIASRRIVN